MTRGLKFVNVDIAQMIGLLKKATRLNQAVQGTIDIVQLNTYPNNGGVTEWFKEPAWNAGAGKLVEGSNPSLSAIYHSKGSVIGIDGRVPETGMP